MKLQDKVAVITGAGRGIGEATAFKFAKEGAKVVVADMNEDEINATVAAVKEMGAEATGFVVNVTKREEVKNLMAHAVETFGRVDVVVNNAGITADAQLLKMTDEQWDRVIDVNLKGVFMVSQEAAAIMKEQQGGVILNASSVVGSYGNFGQTNYAATKWGVNGMTKTWAKELGRFNVRVNAVAPGFILTPMTAKMPEKVLDMMKDKSVLNDLGTPEDIANGYAFLASDEARFITGTILSIDGGVVI
ncbi:3-oxoacyl-[acyl-carrier-protein] reductase [Alkalihalophilus marmarensis]|jgi:3-oxoacyl-[acyl-carrier protein] reductase|uniref:3-oxoacyl-[acyl-carrier-protein] reductase n=1 Tax=Alkalihalophilus marmarensis DSM 21297 TaxID=1188261 RepID=U6SUN9_9BACI|nr:3-oxoacyl-[acyl-carrier-protein] reductase [Alkalihalophilus marmarensis]ERN54356.1 short-chain dehydrogenase [Alkalihalophilus marmarensis DSM 21297]MCM3488269.1 3-oxoacyl-[acyl-carrier-protein] reductase [Alkalihalophilus marmarensis]